MSKWRKVNLAVLMAAAARSGEEYRRSMDKLTGISAEAAVDREALQRLEETVQRISPDPLLSQKHEGLEASFLAAVEAHKSHRQAWRLDPDGFHRCPECDPVSPAAAARPTVCPCGHPVGDEYLCIEGRIYGPCGDENCGGVCDDTHGYCKVDGCACEETE